MCTYSTFNSRFFFFLGFDYISIPLTYLIIYLIMYLGLDLDLDLDSC
jgi:hypothetical protein